MKSLYLSLLMLMLAVVAAAAAQTPSSATGAPGVVVTRHRWRQEVSNPALDDDPFRANDEQREMVRAQREVARQNSIRERMGQRPLPQPTPTMPNVVVEDNSIRYSYAYEINIRNTGAQRIRTIVWGVRDLRSGNPK